MNTRLKQFLAAENISQAQFADSINVVRASVSHVLSGRNNPSFDFIKAMMIKYPQLNIEWLMFGKGKMYKDQQAPDNDPKHSTLLFEDFDNVSEEPMIFPEKDFKSDILSSNAPSTLNEDAKLPESQRKVAKIIILYDDGTYQEM